VPLASRERPLARAWLRSASTIAVSQKASRSVITMTIAHIPAVVPVV
jgi:hypothetical protein